MDSASIARYIARIIGGLLELSREHDELSLLAYLLETAQAEAIARGDDRS